MLKLLYLTPKIVENILTLFSSSRQLKPVPVSDFAHISFVHKNTSGPMRTIHHPFVEIILKMLILISVIFTYLVIFGIFQQRFKGHFKILLPLRKLRNCKTQSVQSIVGHPVDLIKIRYNFQNALQE